MYLKANAKINLSINVINKRKDGYHNLDMVMLPIDLSDTIVTNRLFLKKENNVVINDAPVTYLNNICMNVINEITKRFNIKPKYEFAIYKEIPIEAGLGGGSSDAASIYNFYQKKFKLNLPKEEIINLLKPYGSDIPFFVINKPARIKGVGDIIEPIHVKNDYYVLIVKPKQGLSTKEIYSKLNQDQIIVADIDNVIKALEEGDDELLVKSIGNALEGPAIKLCPKILEIKNYLMSQGLPITLMTGSGSAVFSMSTSKDKISQTVYNLKRLNYQVYLTKLLKD